MYYNVVQEMTVSQTLTIRLPDELRKELETIAKRDHVPVSEIVRKSLGRYLSLRRFQSLRGKVLPHAQRRGFLTDEDVFREMS